MRNNRGWIVLILIGCEGPVSGEYCGEFSEEECALREALGVPTEAKTVVIFSQTSHLDIDWQKTFDEYYSDYVETAFLQAGTLLESDPRNRYQVAEMAFLQQHLEQHPEALATFREAAERGGLRVVGGGMTSPDTLLPETELLGRDFLFGMAFAYDTLGAHPTAAWLPDSFGHSGTAPDMLVAAGFESVAFSRLDGDGTVLEKILAPDTPPIVGSTAEYLLSLGSADFVWHGAGGGSVLAHFMANPRLYCMGDNLDYEENLEIPGGHLGAYFGYDTAKTDARVDQYLAELAPYASTEYRFVPVGCDFAAPKELLLDYLDGYNTRRYPETGAWAVVAPFDDYAGLVALHSNELPEVTGELSPYFMGFYGTRPEVKRRVREAARPFFTAEVFAVVLGDIGRQIMVDAGPELALLTRADHHDFITGTANDEVVAAEQLPLLNAAEAAGNTALDSIVFELADRVAVADLAQQRLLVLNATGAQRNEVVTVLADDWPVGDFHAEVAGVEVASELLADGSGVQVALTDVPSFGWTTVNVVPGAISALPSGVSLQFLDESGLPTTAEGAATVTLANTRVSATWSKNAGRFALTSLVIDGGQALGGPSLSIATYTDDGGLWRMGQEMAGCALTPAVFDAVTDVVEVPTGSALVRSVHFVSSNGDAVEASLSSLSDGLDVAITLSAAEGTTRTVAATFNVSPDSLLTTSSPGGWVERVSQRVYTPTFWPAVGWAQVGEWAVLLRQSTGVRMDVPGVVEWVSARDARSEKCDAEGGTGSDPDAHRFEWRIVRASSAIVAEQASQVFNRPLVAASVGITPTRGDLAEQGSVARISGGGVISTIKPADRGEGVILRAILAGPATVELGPEISATSGTLVDLAERDLSEMGALGSEIALDPAESGRIVSFRLE